MTEHSCITLTHGDPKKGHGIAKRRSVGFILPNLEVKFIDPDTGRSLPKNTPGEICVRSQCVMRGTFNYYYFFFLCFKDDIIILTIKLIN